MKQLRLLLEDFKRKGEAADLRQCGVHTTSFLLRDSLHARERVTGCCNRFEVLESFEQLDGEEIANRFRNR